jgi:hypothetical protein
MADAWTRLFGQKRATGMGSLIRDYHGRLGGTRLLFQIPTDHHYVSSFLLNKCEQLMQA